MANLITTPTFTFSQGDVFDGAERPLQITYYNSGIVEISQEGSYDEPDHIIIKIDLLNKLVKEIQKHNIEAQRILSK